MGFRSYVKNVQPLGAGQTAVITLGTGKNAPTLDRLQLLLSGTTFDATKVLGIRGFMNGREFYVEGTGTVHNKRADYLGLYNDAAEIVLDFTEPNARSAIEQNLSAIPMSLLQDLRFEVDIAGTAVAPMITPIAHFRAPTANPFVKKVRRIPQGFAAGGEQVIYLPNGPSGSKLVRAWIHEGSAGNITAVELRARNAVGFETTRAAMEKSQKRNGLTPVAGVAVIDFIEDGNLAGWFDTQALSDVELRLTGTAADNYQVYLEYLDPIAHL
jgi:hypothetical protein